MKKFKITFKHTVEEWYETIVEAETREEAEEVFDDDPFMNVNEDPFDTQGLEIEIDDIEEL